MKRKFLSAIAIAMIFIAWHAQPASAYFVANKEWWSGKIVSDLYQVAGECTSGPHVVSRINLHEYKVMPQHCFKDCQSCPWRTTQQFTSVLDYDGYNAHDQAGMLLPTNSAYAYYDLVLVDLGVSGIAGTNKSKYYCDGGVPNNCSSYWGAGSGANGYSEGSIWNVKSAATPVQGASVCKNGAISGTSCGEVLQAWHTAGNGWDYWGMIAVDVNNCGAVAGDSGAPVMTGTLSNGTLLGMVTKGYEGDSFVAGDPCYWPARTVYQNFIFIPWATIQAAYNTLSLVPVTV